jgi:hypothetical protein
MLRLLLFQVGLAENIKHYSLKSRQTLLQQCANQLRGDDNLTADVREQYPV